MRVKSALVPYKTVISCDFFRSRSAKSHKEDRVFDTPDIKATENDSLAQFFQFVRVNVSNAKMKSDVFRVD